MKENCVWLARDKGGDLYVFSSEPYLEDGEWYCDCSPDDLYSKIDNEFFPEVTFENSPKQLIIKQD